MHELSITESLVSAVQERIDGEVRSVTLIVGALSGVVPDSVRFCFEVCTKGTRLDGARLDIVEIPGRARCRDCLDEVQITDRIALCHCGSASLDLVAGEELSIKHVEVVA